MSAKSSKVKKNKVESKQEVSVDIPSNLANIDLYLANLDKKQQALTNAVKEVHTKHLQELDDEQALLLLL